MSTAVQFNSAQLLPVKAAALLVPYSRDYVARLAREGKVVAVQIDRQWFVDATSLKNFFEHSAIEESVRKRHLSVMRKRELEVKEMYRSTLAAISVEQKNNRLRTIGQTSLIVLCGLITGVLFNTTSGYLSQVRFSSIAQVPVGLWFPTEPTALVRSDDVRIEVGNPATINPVFESEEPLSPLTHGIVLFPANTTPNDHNAVADFFSDDVNILMTSTTTGRIISTAGSTTMPELSFVRVPPSVVSRDSVVSKPEVP